jgi:hypothetical protein
LAMSSKTSSTKMSTSWQKSLTWSHGKFIPNDRFNTFQQDNFKANDVRSMILKCISTDWIVKDVCFTTF